VEYFDYYGIKVHRSRVFLIKGKEAPSFVRPRLRGWGMSEVERLIRSINSYLKNQDVVFELLDEAKIDVFKMKGFNAALLQEGGTAKVARRVQGANQIKNFQHALTMDKEDEYEQKQISFSGLGDILTQIRQGVAADVKMPMTKLFGISAAGFSSGEDDIENYNSMIDSEVRAKSKFIIVSVLQICCQIKFGFIPDDLKIVWKPLRILNAKEEEEVKTSKFNRIMSAYQAGLASAQEAKESINKDALVPVELDETTEALPPLAGEYTVEGEAKGTGGKQAKAEA
jgi:phage-related protein (TIGR01555 family)